MKDSKLISSVYLITMSMILISGFNFYFDLTHYLRYTPIFNLGSIVSQSTNLIFLVTIFVYLSILLFIQQKDRIAIFIVLIGAIMGSMGNIIDLLLDFKYQNFSLQSISTNVGFIFFYLAFIIIFYKLYKKSVYFASSELNLKIFYLGIVAVLISYGIKGFNKISSSLFAGKIVTADSVEAVISIAFIISLVSLIRRRII
ncbi:hypothetical protein Halha_2185 [Halobacteroides halobius DSM 5150]|uniref:Uncharacterized protein n=1 Tax=Halobacteroides halobius (strain ATCC 35273 / DSM 5150 / MD-1) TaxID=748449 RepID=L0KAM4_HALHC|nr:hypothetical protein [Halobacteroides halobius]AGB42066.1 hypothetical protein Halha_2185 [Halobacteroides halobius DSM 5150]